MTTQHIQKTSKVFSLISFNFSLSINSNGHALTVVRLISTHNLYMELTSCTKMAALQTSFEDFIKIGDPQQCPLTLKAKLQKGMGGEGGGSIGALTSTFDTIHPIDLIFGTYNERSFYFQLIKTAWCLISFHGNHSHINDFTSGYHLGF